jgi:hypothetical protein
MRHGSTYHRNKAAYHRGYQAGMEASAQLNAETIPKQFLDLLEYCDTGIVDFVLYDKVKACKDWMAKHPPLTMSSSS